MPILIFLILAVMVAQLGFWDTLSAVLGAAAMTVLLVGFAVLLVWLTARTLMRRFRGRL